MRQLVSSLPVTVIAVGLASSISLIGGIGIQSVSERLLELVPLLIALPALNSMVADYATLVAAHAGDPEEQSRTSGDLMFAMLPSIGLGIVFVAASSLFLAEHQGYHVTPDFLWKFVGFVAVSIMSVVSAMLLITFVLGKLLRQHRLNPDDVLLPVVSSIAGIGMLGFIATAAWLLF